MMGKIYDTCISKWEHGKPTDYCNGQPTRNLLGPCPLCGDPTFTYGGSWACSGLYCYRGTNNPVLLVAPEPIWWNTNVNVQKDGNQWCAFYDGYINLMVSVFEFGNTPQQAVDELLKNYPEQFKKGAKP